MKRFVIQKKNGQFYCGVKSAKSDDYYSSDVSEAQIWKQEDIKSPVLLDEGEKFVEVEIIIKEKV